MAAARSGEKKSIEWGSQIRSYVPCARTGWSRTTARASRWAPPTACSTATSTGSSAGRDLTCVETESLHDRRGQPRTGSKSCRKPGTSDDSHGREPRQQEHSLDAREEADPAVGDPRAHSHGRADRLEDGLAQAPRLDLSPATIRNIMADARGARPAASQPHTSAGRSRPPRPIALRRSA